MSDPSRHHERAPSGCLLHLVDHQAERDPGAVAIWARRRTPLGYGGLSRQIRAVVATLRDLGIEQSDRVAVVLPEGPELAVAVLSIASGAAVAPLNPDYRAAEFAAHFDRLGCRALVVPAGSTSPAVAAARERGIRIVELTPLRAAEAGRFTLAEEPGAVVERGRARPAAGAESAGPDDVALVLPTSGTSARPKLVALTHLNLGAAALSIRAALELTDRDRCLNVMPLFHIHGLSTIFASLAAGASVGCSPRFDADRFFEEMETFRPTWYTAAPAIHRAILDRARDHPAIVSRSTLRFIRSASAAMPGPLQADLERLFRVPFIEAYGMTEAGPQIASNRLPPAVRKPGSVGLAAGPEVAIMDEEDDLLTAGQEGEVVVRGPNVITGYANDPEADRDAFVRGWFRTGDRGRLDADGHLFITGRLKELINRGGEKISPREVEQVLEEHPAVAEAVAFPVPHSTLGEDLAVAIVLGAGVDPAVRDPASPSRADLIRAIRRFASLRLADFKIPQLITIVPAIPAGPTGKRRRRDLAESLGLIAGGRRTTEPTAPVTPVEERLTEIWGAVLGVDRIGVHDNFFQVGGDSLTATQVASRVGREFRVVLTARDLFENPTIIELAELVARHPATELPTGETRTEKAVIPRRTASGPGPLSSAQQRLWLLDQLEPGDPAYNMHTALRLSGPLDPGSLERSLGEIVRRHEALRTTFRAGGGPALQIPREPGSLRLALVDLTRLPTPARQREVERLGSEEAARPFHLMHGPLFRAVLYRLGAEEHVLLVTVHHIVSDGWSTGVFLRELSALYQAFSAGRPSPLPELPIQYVDFAVWQRAALGGDALDGQLAYWKRQLDGMPPVLDLPSDRPRPAAPTRKGASHSVPLSAALGEQLRSLSRRENVTPFMTVLAAFQTLLHRYTGQTDIVVGTPVANRNQVELEGLIGFFANTLVIRVDLSGNPTFRDALARLRGVATDAYAHQDLPFERLVEALEPERDHRHNPLFQVMVVSQNGGESGAPESWGDLTVARTEISRPAAKFDLTLYLAESVDGFRTTWQYSTDLFDEARIERMAANFLTLLDGIVADPGARLSDLPVLSPAERRESVIGWNRTEMPYPRDRCFHHLLEDRARTTPDAPAVKCGDREIGYGALDRRANHLARRLRAIGVGPEARVGVCLTRSVEAVVAALAVMKAGGAYVPLDPLYPAEHLAFILDDAGVSVLVTEERVLPLLGRAGPTRTVVLVESGSTEGEAAELDPAAGATAASVAYVIYTSGSTGKPKGVMITHGNLAHYVHAMAAALRIGADDCYLHTASFAFSSSIRQLTVPLAWGARVVVASSEAIRDPNALLEVVKHERVSIIDIVPSYWRSCNRMLGALSPETRADLLTNQLRLILSASEALVSDVPAEWDFLSRHGARVINMYGQTETTGIVTVCPVAPAAGDANRILPIGRPIANCRAYVLDAAGQPAPVGAWGELYIGGAGVGPGYLDDPALTAERFVPDRFSDLSGARLYRTGDGARYRANGDLEFRGRLDQRLKIRGYRIEPELIEGVVDQHPDWRACMVTAVEDASGDKALVACVVPVQSGTGSTRELREWLKRKLPDYMVPSRFVTVERLPRTPGGKLDRSAGLARMRPLAEAARHRAPAGRNGNGGPPSRAEDSGPVSTARAVEILVEIWREVLAVDQVSLDDNFFDLGGNSLLAIEVIGRAEQAGLRLTPRELWRNQTIAELAGVAAAGPEPITPRRAADPVAPDPIPRPSSASIEEDPARVLVTAESLRAYGREALERAGLAPEGAAIVTEVQLEASLRDQATHNMVSIPRYARRIGAGTINPRPDIRIERETPISVRIDGDNGPGQWVAVVAMETAIRLARANGVGIVGVHRSNHLGAAGHYPWLAALEGLVGLCTTNGPVILAPTGGITPTFGNNPLAVGIPAGRYHPILLDIAMSVAPRGKIGLHLAEGKPLPPGWILDRAGKPSIDPADLVAGLGVPIGGHKGYGLALIMEVLAGAMTGARFGWDNRREHGSRMTRPAGFGHFFLAIDPELFIAKADFTARVDRLIEQTKAGERAPDVNEILVPGEAELRARERSLRDGVPLRRSTYDALLKYARAAGLDTELRVIGCQDAPIENTSSSAVT